MFSLLQSNRSAGMTLVEMVMIIGIYTLLMLVITSSITELYKQNSYAMSQANEVENARRGMTQWNRDVKEMTTAEDGTFPVSVIEAHRLGYYSDTDLDESVEYIEYILASTTLSKYTYNAVGTPATYDKATPDSVEILSLYVQNLNEGVTTFEYFNNDGAQLSSTSPLINVRYITAQIVVNIDAIRAPGEFLLKSSIAPRNLKDNL